MPSTPESPNLWDRFFNRYRKEVNDRGNENWSSQSTYGGVPVGEPRVYQRRWVEYKITDRLTGSETIELEYLN